MEAKWQLQMYMSSLLSSQKPHVGTGPSISASLAKLMYVVCLSCVLLVTVSLNHVFACRVTLLLCAKDYTMIMFF